MNEVQISGLTRQTILVTDGRSIGSLLGGALIDSPQESHAVTVDGMRSLLKYVCREDIRIRLDDLEHRQTTISKIHRHSSANTRYHSLMEFECFPTKLLDLID